MSRRNVFWIAVPVVLLIMLPSILTTHTAVFAQDKPTEEVDKGQPPPAEPTKAPPTDEQVQPEKTATPAGGQEQVKTPTPFEPPKTPTWSSRAAATTHTPTPMPSPTVTPEKTADGPTSTRIGASTTTSASDGESRPIQFVQVTGIVFEDSNDNGQHDAGEQGLSGVSVVVDDGSGVSQAAVTDWRGAYGVQTKSTAVVRIIPPEGWENLITVALPASEAGDFPLRRRVDEVAPVSSSAPVTITQAVYDFSTLALSVAALGATIFIAIERLRRALVTQFNSWALTHIRLSRESLHISRQAQAALDDPLRVLNQAVLDATGENVNLIALPQAAQAPYPVIVTLADDRRRFIFTPVAPEIMRRRENRHRAVSLLNVEPGSVATYPLDALNSSLFIADDLAAIYAAELKKRSAGESPVLPRVQRWYLYVAPSPADHLPARRTYLRRRLPTLRAILRR